MSRYRIGVDVGGTFTDILCLDTEIQALSAAKVPSLPGSQWRGVLNALGELGIDTGEIRAFVHGTTIATNALLERLTQHGLCLHSTTLNTIDDNQCTIGDTKCCCHFRREVNMPRGVDEVD